MSDARVLVTGFGAFEEVDQNPSGRLAADLDGHLLHGEGEGAQVVGTTLPVSFLRAPEAFEELVAAHAPVFVLSLGVHKGTRLRIERGARAELAPGRPDADGMDAAQLPRIEAPRIGTRFDVERLQRVLEGRSGTSVELSSDAGRYVCECVYRRALEWGSRTDRPCLFLHVPAFEHLPFDLQRDALRALLEDLLLQARADA